MISCLRFSGLAELLRQTNKAELEYELHFSNSIDLRFTLQNNINLSYIKNQIPQVFQFVTIN